MNKFSTLPFVVFAVIAFTLGTGWADTGWEDNFDPIKATWDEVSADWDDITGTTAKLTEADASESYGVAISETITLDVGKYSELLVKTTQVDSGAYYSVQIQEVGGAEDANDAVSYAGSPATHIVDIAELMGWSGTKSFVINIWIDGESKGATFDILRIREPVSQEGWIENFDPIKDSWAETSADWNDITGPTAIVTESDPCENYGFVQSETITLDVNEYSELVISTTDIDPDTYYTVQIQQVGGAEDANDAVSYIGEPGTQIVDISELMGWSDTKSFVINVWIDGNDGSVTFDLLQVRKASPGRTGWLEDFEPIRNTWVETTCYWTDTAGPNAVVTENDPCNSYGFTSSEVLTLDVNEFDQLYIKTTEVESGCYYSVQIHEVGDNPDYEDAVSYMGSPSEHFVDIPDLMGWSGTKTFQINIWLEGEGLSTTFDTIEVCNSELSERPNPVFWEDDFDPILTTWDEISAYWTDISGSDAILTEDNQGGYYGKVESETINPDLNIYPELTVVVTDIDDSSYLDVGVQGQVSPWAYYDLFTSSITEPNTYTADISSVTGWSGSDVPFKVVFWINGESKSAQFDLVKVHMDCGTDVLSGDYCEDCIVDLKDIAVISQSWMDDYDTFDLKDIAENWLSEEY
jgi:hypothetical protein